MWGGVGPFRFGVGRVDVPRFVALDAGPDQVKVGRLIDGEADGVDPVGFMAPLFAKVSMVSDEDTMPSGTVCPKLW